eukprot:scaffold554260_cov13-Prasinocladus_malaysianus.AAC.1
MVGIVLQMPDAPTPSTSIPQSAGVVSRAFPSRSDLKADGSLSADGSLAATGLSVSRAGRTGKN